MCGVTACRYWVHIGLALGFATVCQPYIYVRVLWRVCGVAWYDGFVICYFFLEVVSYVAQCF